MPANPVGELIRARVRKFTPALIKRRDIAALRVPARENVRRLKISWVKRRRTSVGERCKAFSTGNLHFRRMRFALCKCEFSLSVRRAGLFTCFCGAWSWHLHC